MLSAAQIQSFHDNGFVHIPGLLPAETLAPLRRAADRLQADALARLAEPDYLDGVSRASRDWIEHPRDHYVYREKPGGTLGFHRVERMFEQDPVFRRLAVDSRLLQIVWQALERPFWPRGSSLVVKLPHEGAAVRWHQDIPYLYWSSGGHTSQGRPATHPVPNFTTDIYLEPSTRANGCLWALPGTHKNGTVDVDRLVAQHGFELPGAVPLEAAPGDVMLHHVAVVHGSPENRSTALRRTLYIHYMSDETVRDAYADWPDLLSPEEAERFWGAALADHGGVLGDRSASQFRATPEGLRPA